MDGISNARVNLTQRRVTVQWQDDTTPPAVAERLLALGYPAQLITTTEQTSDNRLSHLLRALAVAGFASGNIMLLSVSIWSGADTPSTQLFHWVSAMIALPAIAYSGQVFFRSAYAALRRGATNMDVPITIGIVLALCLSCYDTVTHNDSASVYFEAPVMLVFFLLIGRTLDYLMRDKVRKAADGLARLEPAGVWRITKDNTVYTALDEIEEGDQLLIKAGEAVAVDCEIHTGRSELDSSLVTGESIPVQVQSGDHLLAGTRNLTANLQVTATAPATKSHLAQVIALIQSAELSRSQSQNLADRVSRWYAPVVHSAAFLSFLLWYFVTGGVHQSITVAIAVLIITCPCALGLAVPMVQVVVVRKLFSSGVLLKDGSALERLAKVDTVVFDKTGTLTTGEPRLTNTDSIDNSAFGIAAAMAQSSVHPYSRAIVRNYITAGNEAPTLKGTVTEHPGLGLEFTDGDRCYRLGKTEWATDNTDSDPASGNGYESKTTLSSNGRIAASFIFEDTLRDDAKATVSELKDRGLAVECISGDNDAAVAGTVKQLGIDQYQAAVLPADKVDRINALSDAGQHVLMLGDGLNDAPALASAYVSMAPGAASDVGRNTADIVFTGNDLSAVPEVLRLAKTARRCIQQNLGFALLYNAIALPVAVAGLVTPLIAALAMSASSMIVILNALRLHYQQLSGEQHNKKASDTNKLKNHRKLPAQSHQHA